MEIQNLKPQLQTFHKKVVSSKMGIEVYYSPEIEHSAVSFVKLFWRCSNKHDLTLSVYPKNDIAKVQKAFGAQDIIINKPQFDKQFVIQSNEPICALDLLDNSFCAQLLELDRTVLGGQYEFKLEGAKLYYKETYTKFSVDDYNRIIDIIELGKHLVQNINDYNLPG